MIDYEKLRKAHELARKLNKYFSGICIDNQWFTFVNNEIHEYYTLSLPPSANYAFDSLDDLIEKLEELTRPKPKYKVGDYVWFIDCTMRDGPIGYGFIESQEYRELLFHENKWFATIGDLEITENCLYPSRESLINAQIDHWQKQLFELEECEHEFRTCIVEGYLSHVVRCKKCGAEK